MLAMLLKPGSPKDLVVSLACAPIYLTVDLFFQRVEELRNQLKSRPNREAIDAVEKESGSSS